VDTAVSYADALVLDVLSAEWQRAVAEVMRERREDARVRETSAALATMRGI